MRRVDAAILILVLMLASPALAGDRFFDSGGVSIRYVLEGRGKPVVLIHGFSRNIERGWGEPGILDALAADYRVIALDCRGHGKSGKPQGDSAYGYRMVEDVARLLDHLGIGRAYLIGHSMGGRIALKFATSHPDRVLGVVLVGAGRTRKGEDLWSNVAVALDRGEGIRPLISYISPEGGLPEEEIQAVNEQTMAVNDAGALASIARRYGEFASSDEEVGKLRAPMLAVIGSEDPFRDDVNALKEGAPALRIVVIDRADHVTVLDRPELVDAVKAFLK